MKKNKYYYRVTPQSGYYTKHYQPIDEADYNRLLSEWGDDENPGVDYTDFIMKVGFPLDENGLSEVQHVQI